MGLYQSTGKGIALCFINMCIVYPLTRWNPIFKTSSLIILHVYAAPFYAYPEVSFAFILQ